MSLNYDCLEKFKWILLVFTFHNHFLADSKQGTPLIKSNKIDQFDTEYIILSQF